VLGRIIFLALLFYLVYLVVRFFQSLGKSNRQKNPGSSSTSRKLMVKDEVCNTYIQEDEALKEVHNGQVHYFCSEECRKKFLSSREKAS
jgi:YHS domain-containing protein